MATDAFAPVRLGALALRNRVIKTATYEGMCPGGIPSQALVEHHRALAAGGVGMTTVAYCAVSADGRTFADQMFMRPEVIGPLRRRMQSDRSARSRCTHCNICVAEMDRSGVRCVLD